MSELGGALAPDTISFNALMNGYAKAGDTANALSVLRDELPAAGLSPDAVSYTTALAACNSTAEWRTALELVQQAERSPKVELDTLGYSMAIGALVQGSQVHTAHAHAHARLHSPPPSLAR